jgi:hypothetical protein
MPGGRPTQDPKETLIAVRLATRQLRVLQARAQREHVALSEALRRCVDEWAAGAAGARRAPTPPPPAPRRRTAKTPPPPAVPSTPPGPAEAIDLATFARTVLTIARGISASSTADGLARGRFGPRKVFLADVRRQLGPLPRAEVDGLLLAAHRAGLLELVRANLVAAMDPAEVRDSEIESPTGARYHFVVAD